VALVVELVALPLAERGRVAPQVDGDVPDAPPRAADQLRLSGEVVLEVQPAQDPGARAGVVVLDEVGGDPGRAPRLGAVGLDEEAAVVAVDVGLERDDALELALEDLHANSDPYCFS
jgi:hypothetical protein